MLSENTRVRAKIHTAFEHLAIPHVAKVRRVSVSFQAVLEAHVLCNQVRTEEFFI